MVASVVSRTRFLLPSSRLLLRCREAHQCLRRLRREQRLPLWQVCSSLHNWMHLHHSGSVCLLCILPEQLCSFCVLTAKYQNFFRLLLLSLQEMRICLRHFRHSLHTASLRTYAHRCGRNQLFVFFQFSRLFVRHAAAEILHNGFCFTNVFLMTIENRLSAKGVLTVAGSDFDGLHWRCGSFGKAVP